MYNPNSILKRIYMIFGLILFLSFKVFSQVNPTDTISNSKTDSTQKKEESVFRKAPYLIIINSASILSIGIFKWEWGSQRFAFRTENYFGANTTHGGADKAGHLYSTYILSNVNAHFLKQRGVKNYLEYGVLLAWSNMLMVELGDGFSKSNGFSNEDLVFNTIGAGISYLRGKNEFAKKFLDIRLEFTPSEFSLDAISETNYTDMKYITVMKPAAFTSSFLKFTELHVGYYTRGYTGLRAYEYATENRTLYLGLSLNLHSLILNRYSKYKSVKLLGDILHGVQIPRSYIPVNVFHSETNR